MIKFKTGNIFDSNAQALVNTVNTVGVMGKGIALQFKKNFPNNYRIYREACRNNELKIGQLLVTEEETMFHGKKIIINFPTKKHWRQSSDYIYIEKGLEALKKIVNEYNIESIAIPPLGSGNGGLQWHKVRNMIEQSLKDTPIEIQIYEPNKAIKEVLKKERVKLTPARAMLLSVLYELVRNGEFVSEFSAEKVAYFLQRFGGGEELKLEFKPNFYGPYSGKVRQVLHYLNGSYIMGYYSKDKKPFDELSLIMDAEPEVNRYLEQPENLKLKAIVDQTKKFLTNNYSAFALELLSTLDFLKNNNVSSINEKLFKELQNWSDRKRTIFSNQRFVEIANKKLENQFVY